MDAITQYRLHTEFCRLDRALGRGDRVAADLARMDINRILLESSPPKKESIPLLDGMPPWVRDLVRNRGIRLRALERAFDMRKVVLSPTAGKQGYGLRIEMKF